MLAQPITTARRIQLYAAYALYYLGMVCIELCGGYL